MGLIISLIILGLVLLFAEILLIPGIGVAGILGVISMAVACYLAFVNYSLATGLIVLAVILVILILMLIWVLRAKTWKRMSLDTNIDSKAVVQRINLAVGDRGVALTRLAPMGNARFDDEIVEVTSLEGIIPPGTEVEVVMLEGIKVTVRSCR
ncbi:MAG: serine protease [Bacteroidales bacterium]|nr:serine protease [Bacteroidales bacterium]